MKKLALALALALPFAAQAADSASNQLSECYIQEIIPGKNMTGGGFLLQHSGKEQKIVKAEIPSITKTVELHEMIMKDNVMQMQQITEYPLEEGENRFKKGSFHLMLMNVAEDKFPTIGSTHTVKLGLDDGEVLECEAKVLSVSEVMALFETKVESAHAHHHDHHGHSDKHDHEHGDKAAPAVHKH